MKEQIEKLKNDITECYGCDPMYYGTDGAFLAENLVKMGWRKQSEGEWKQTEEPMGWHDVDCVECSACGESWVMNDNLDFDLIVEYWHYCPNCGAHMKGGAE